MNQRPTRAPAPPDQDPRDVAEAEFTEAPAVRPAAQLPTVHRTTEAAIETSKTVSERPDPVEEVLPESGPAAVITAIAAIMAELKPVEKSGWNDFHKYWHVRMQDLSRELTPLMGKHGIVVFQTEEGRELFDGGNVVAVRYRFTVVHKSGAIWPQRPLQTGVSACRSTKGTFDDKTLNKCHTSARKYFLLSLFQIASDDAEDADTDGGAPKQRPQGNAAPRRAPSPDGKVKPHLLPVVDQELPQAWADRFIKAIAKATPAEVDGWYDANFVVFEKLKKGGFTAIYDELIDAMDKRGGEPEQKADPISSGPPPADAKADADNLWLESLDNAFSSCEDAASLSAEQLRHMTPMKGKVGGNAWNAAVDLVKTHLDRVTAEDK